MNEFFLCKILEKMFGKFALSVSGWKNLCYHVMLFLLEWCMASWLDWTWGNWEKFLTNCAINRFFYVSDCYSSKTKLQPKLGIHFFIVVTTLANALNCKGHLLDYKTKDKSEKYSNSPRTCEWKISVHSQMEW